MTIYGIDSDSKRVAVTWWSGRRYQSRFYDVWDCWSVEAAPWFGKIMRRFFRNQNLNPNDFVFLEAPVVAGARNIQSTIKQAMVNGIIQEVIGEQGATCVLTAISTWKASAAYSGRASKEEVAQAVQDHAPTHYESIAHNQNLIDATGLCIHGRTVVHGLEITKPVPA